MNDTQKDMMTLELRWHLKILNLLELFVVDFGSNLLEALNIEKRKKITFNLKINIYFGFSDNNCFDCLSCSTTDYVFTFAVGALIQPSHVTSPTQTDDWLLMLIINIGDCPASASGPEGFYTNKLD